MPPRKKIITEQPSISTPVVEPNKTVKGVDQIANLEKLKTLLTQEINDLFNSLIKEINSIESLKKKTQEELELQKRQKKQEEEEQSFNFLLTLKKKQAEFDESIEKDKTTFQEYQKQKHEDLMEQKENLDNQEKEFRQLKAQVESFPKELEKSIEEAKKIISVELKKDFETEKNLLIQKYESNIKLLEQQIGTLREQLKQLEKENQAIKDEKTGAIEQVKDLAIAMVRGKEKDIQSSAI